MRYNFTSLLGDEFEHFTVNVSYQSARYKKSIMIYLPVVLYY